jgi:hypothetical protein
MGSCHIPVFRSASGLPTRWHSMTGPLILSYSELSLPVRSVRLLPDSRRRGSRAFESRMVGNLRFLRIRDDARTPTGQVSIPTRWNLADSSPGIRLTGCLRVVIVRTSSSSATTLMRPPLSTSSAKIGHLGSANGGRHFRELRRKRRNHLRPITNFAARRKAKYGRPTSA